MRIPRRSSLPAAVALGALVLALVLGPGGEPVSRGQAVTPYAELPLEAWELEPGEDAQLVQAFCTICHSLAPIIQHQGFTKEMWAQEVDKMRQQHGAPVDDATAAKIVAYLQEHYSQEALQAGR
ncbi:hypothetical protein [Limnochorda pilosa]|uniref:Sulfite:cytochrome C oxidoreductase subunit B n=1 Tax=Limnochorda pilosa TaxID=1555112 RepID=A0A0K2SFY9_LIMPI|nr:hypothetical protein [Limnochorda pilosa]BAS26005.1 sulfite:cytochrome C oxidoreductase subunit B [Limnochorda pilosa]